MNKEELYESYKSSEECLFKRLSVFTDKHGYLNENAFQDFTKSIVNNPDDKDYYLICFNVDLRNANAESMAAGDYALRRFIVSLEDFFVFRIQGEKFNALVTQEEIPRIKTLLDKPNPLYKVYYGIVSDTPFHPQNAIEEREMIRKGIALMYENKGEKKVVATDDVVSVKGNTPKELQETKLRKYRKTMWYTTITLTLTNPKYKEVTIFIYPTEIKSNLQRVNIICAVYDNVHYNVKCGNEVTFGIDGYRFTVFSRFNRDGHLDTAIYCVDKDKCKYQMTHDTHEGVCIPASFGKRLSQSREIYPLRKSSNGMYDYVDYNMDDNTVSVNTDGYVTTPSGTKYGVFMDAECIDLTKI
jgi:hypothetical protein